MLLIPFDARNVQTSFTCQYSHLSWIDSISLVVGAPTEPSPVEKYWECALIQSEPSIVLACLAPPLVLQETGQSLLPYFNCNDRFVGDVHGLALNRVGLRVVDTV